MNAKYIFIFVFVVGVLAAFAGLSYVSLEQQEPAVSDFESCVRAGNPVLESYPRQCRTPDGRTFVEEIAAALIRLQAPQPNELVKSPLALFGEARGTWFFEASFPLELLDANGNTVVETYAEAKMPWMTEDFVPFSSVLSFEEPLTDTGTLVLKKDNPSGLPEHDAEVRIPVRFDRSTETMAVLLYFSLEDAAVAGNCSITAPVTKNIPRTTSVARATLESLIREDPEIPGLTNLIPQGADIEFSIGIEGGIARIDFTEGLENIGGSCRVTAIRSQIEHTLLQFPTVDEVVISVDGNVEEALQP
jgi:hypothetical protein